MEKYFLAHLVVFDMFFTTKITYILSLSEWQPTDKLLQMKDHALCSPS